MTIENYYKELNQYFNEKDVSAISHLMKQPFTLLSRGMHVCLYDLEDILIHMEHLFSFHEMYGVEKYKIMVESISPYPKHFFHVNLRYFVFDADKEFLIDYQSSHILEEMNGSYKICFVIAHNEVENFRLLK